MTHQLPRLRAEAGSARLHLIYRQVSFELAAFNRLKDWQRKLESEHGRRVTNSEALSRLILAAPAP